MLCVPEDKLRYEVIVCSNCKSERVSTRWVYRYGESKPKQMFMEDKIGLLEPPTFLTSPMGFAGCGDCSATSIPIQVVMSCDECGFTVVRER